MTRNWTVLATECSAERMWIKVRAGGETALAIHVETDGSSVCVEPGDQLWWRDRLVYWTPALGRSARLNALINAPLTLLGYADPETPWAERKAEWRKEAGK